MIASMTGYGAAVLRSDALQASVQIRSVNHRFLELSLHMPRRLLALEPELKRLVHSRVQRGKLELSISARFEAGEPELVRASEPLVTGVVRVLRELKRAHALEGDVSVSDVARFPNAIEVQETLAAEGPDPQPLIELAQQAIADLLGQRQAEGAQLARVLGDCLGRLSEGVARLGALSAETRAARQQVLAERLKEAVSGLGLDEGRLHQEVVRLVERADVAEELARLTSHVELCRATLERGGPCGKRLDFLSQELMREANTVGSKAAAAPMIHEVVGLKGEIERFREQVQNVE
jgi:uncharacterized protein (TIGR00255 family)